MPNTLILIRHSQSQPKPERPASQWQLTKEGRRLCIALAERLAAYAPDVIVTSRERKASATGALVAARLGRPIAVGVAKRSPNHGNSFATSAVIHTRSK
jgi:broad specificity phosphatase PhoE